MTLRLADEDGRRLANLAAAGGCSKQKSVRSALAVVGLHKEQHLDEAV